MQPPLIARAHHHGATAAQAEAATNHLFSFFIQKRSTGDDFIALLPSRVITCYFATRVITDRPNALPDRRIDPRVGQLQRRRTARVSLTFARFIEYRERPRPAQRLSPGYPRLQRGSHDDKSGQGFIGDSAVTPHTPYASTRPVLACPRAMCEGRRRRRRCRRIRSRKVPRCLTHRVGYKTGAVAPLPFSFFFRRAAWPFLFCLLVFRVR